MSEFPDREKAFENKFEHDEELGFRIASRTAHLFGLWAAEQMGLKGTDADAYAKQAVAAVLNKMGHDRLVEKIEQDLKAKGLEFSRHRLEKEIGTLHVAAQEQISGKP